MRSSDPLDFTSLSVSSIKKFLSPLEPLCARDLLVVPTVFVQLFRSETSATVVDVFGIPSPLNSFARLLWASERVDRESRAARHFYSRRKPVLVLQDVGPAKPYMHDPVKELVLNEEYSAQVEEGIEKFSFGVGADFANLMSAIDWAMKSPHADIVEIGAFNGSSSATMVNYINKCGGRNRLFVYDTFEGFNYDVALSSPDAGWFGTHKSIGIGRIQRLLNLRASSGNAPVVIQRNVLNSQGIDECGPIALASIDVDMYEAVLRSLRLVDEKLIKGGLVLVEDAGHTPWLLGAKIALDVFLEECPPLRYFSIPLDSGQYLLVRQ